MKIGVKRSNLKYKIKQIIVVSISFLLLEGISLTFLSLNSDIYKFLIRNFSLDIIGRVHKVVENIREYFSLKQKYLLVMRENAFLYKIMGSSGEVFKGKDIKGVIPTSILQVNYKSNSVFFLIDKGKKDGVLEGLPIIFNNVLVGKVYISSYNYSLCLGLQNILMSAAVRVKNSNAPGLLRWTGRYPNYVEIQEIPAFLDANIGDTVITAGGDAFAPRGLIVGTIHNKDTSDVLSYTAIVKPIINVQSLKLGYVLIDTSFTEIFYLVEEIQ